MRSLVTVQKALFCLVLLLLAGAADARAQTAPPAPPLGSVLKKGTVLHFIMNGKAGPPSRVEVAQVGIPLRGMKACSQFVINTAGADKPDARELCRVGNLQLIWDSTATAWRPGRPLGARDSLTLERADGGSTRYRTGDLSTTKIGTETFTVVPTEVMMFDEKGNPQSRLRELYSTTLATAVQGTLAVPDLKLPDGWREELSFQLVKIEQPK